MKMKKMADLLGITDDQMFQNVMKEPANCQGLLQAILPEIPIKQVEVHTQERIGRDPRHKTSILDVWVKDDEDRLYDVEMQVADQKDLPLRARFYMHALDEEALFSGEGYKALRPAYVIFIIPFDPKNRHFRDYRFVYSDKRDKRIELGDRSEIILLNTKGRVGKITPDLQDFYNLVNGQKTSASPFMKNVKETMARYRGTEGWRKHAMNFQEILEKSSNEIKIDDIRKMISALRPYMNDRQIYNQLLQDYGKDFDNDELKHLLETTK